MVAVRNARHRLQHGVRLAGGFQQGHPRHDQNHHEKPIITQSFDPCDLDAGDAALKKIWDLAIKQQNAAALANQDVLIVHHYAGTAKTAVFAERYDASMVKPSSLGGEGGGSVGMPIDVTLGGNRTTGTAAVGSNGAITFTPDAA